MPDTTHALAYYYSNRKTGGLAIVQCGNGKTEVRLLESDPESTLAPALKPILIGATKDHQVVVLDPKSKELRLQARLPADIFAAHVYSDPYSRRDWYMNDGDKDTGNDSLNCGDKGSSVTVIEDSGSPRARYLKTLCVGRGHHQACFTAPSAMASEVPRRVYISSLTDGTISVIGNDPAEPRHYLQVIATIDLCEPDKEDGGRAVTPNNAFPHGLAYSPVSGKVYNLNNGYGSIAVIDPVSNNIEARLPFKGHSNLIAIPGGRYLLGRGADRKSDPNHVLAKLTVLDITSGAVTDQLSLPDIYLSKYYFNPEGSKLYFTTSASGSPAQLVHVKQDALLVFDLGALPKLKLVKELRLGSPTGSLAFHAVHGRTDRVYASLSEQGKLAVIDGGHDTLLEQVAVGTQVPHSRVWLLTG